MPSARRSRRSRRRAPGRGRLPRPAASSGRATCTTRVRRPSAESPDEAQQGIVGERPRHHEHAAGPRRRGVVDARRRPEASAAVIGRRPASPRAGLAGLLREPPFESRQVGGQRLHDPVPRRAGQRQHEHPAGVGGGQQVAQAPHGVAAAGHQQHVVLRRAVEEGVGRGDQAGDVRAGHGVDAERVSAGGRARVLQVFAQPARRVAGAGDQLEGQEIAGVVGVGHAKGKLRSPGARRQERSRA